MNNLFRRALGQVVEVLVPAKGGVLDKLKVEPGELRAQPKTPRLNWGAGNAPTAPLQGELERLSGAARSNEWSPADTGDAIAACYWLALQRLDDRNILRRTYSAKSDTICELVHDQMGPMLVQWAEARRGTWNDCVSSLVALSGGPPITIESDLIQGGQYEDLTWRGCTVQPRGEWLTFESLVFKRCELRGIVFDRCTFRDVQFERCNLSGAIFRNCVFEPGPKTAKSVRIANSSENDLNCLLFIGSRISDVEFQKCVVRQPSIVEAELSGDMVFENCVVVQLYAAALTGPRTTKIKIPAGSRGWCCSADPVSFSRLEVSPEAHVSSGAVVTVEKPQDLALRAPATT